MESADSTQPVDTGKLMRRIEIIDTEKMLLGKIWQAVRSVCMTLIIELQKERREIIAQLGHEVDNGWLMSNDIWRT